MTNTTLPATTVQAPAEPLSLVADIYQPVELVPYFSAVVYSDEALKEAIARNYCEIYIVSKNGLFRRTTLTHGRHVTVPCPVPPPGMGIKLPETIQDTSGFFPAGKVPVNLLDDIVNFFRAVMKVHGTTLEAQAFVLWNPERGYYIKVPEQTVSGASVEYKWSELLGPTDVIVLDIHSHNSMGAFFSGTDDRDDNGNCTISGVIGKLTATSYEYIWRFNLPGNMKINKLELGEIFAPKSSDPVPQEWLDKVKKETITYGRGLGVGVGAAGYRSVQRPVGGTTPGVVPNPNAKGVSGLSAQDEEVLAHFGFPFAEDREGDRPFGKPSKKGITSGKTQKRTRLGAGKSIRTLRDTE